MKALRLLLKELFPSFRCMVCNGEDKDLDNRYCLCPKCKNALPYVLAPCEKCGRETPDNHKFCEECRHNKRYFDIARSSFLYTGDIKKAYLQYKFGDNKYAAEYFAAFLVDKYIENAFHCDGVCAVPAYRKNKRSKKLNHTELLAYHFSDMTTLPLLGGLYKKAGIPKQVGLSGKERRENAVNAYYADKDAFKGKNVLLIDDVFTTGSTMNNVAKILKEEGKAKSVTCLTLFSVGALPSNGKINEDNTN